MQAAPNLKMAVKKFRENFFCLAHHNVAMYKKKKFDVSIIFLVVICDALSYQSHISLFCSIKLNLLAKLLLI